MHDLIQDLGRDIARKESPFDLGKRRRLWHYEDVLRVLKNNTKFEHLTLMNLSNCDSITKLPDVSTTPNLTKVLANDCPNLTEIHDSVGFLDKLVILSAEGCPKLNKLPNGMRSTCLDSLNLGKCSSIQQFPDMSAKMGKISKIDIEGTAIQKFPTSIENLVGVEELVLKSCTVLEDIPINTDMFQNLQELNVEGCPQLRKILGKSLVDRLPNLNRLILRNCGLEDEDLELILRNFVKLKWLVLSENNFVTIPACIEDLANLALLHLENCKKLEKISVVPPYLEYIDARNCISLTPKSSNVLLQQAFHEVEYIDIVVFKKRIPKWFDLCREGGSVSFWVCRKFPAIAVFFLLEGQNETNNTLICDFHLLINGFQVYQTEREFLVDHVHLFDLRILLIGREWQGLNEHLKHGWNHVQISCTVKNTTQLGTVKCCGIHLYKERMNIHDVSFINPDLHGSNLAYEDMDDALDIYDEVEDEEDDDDVDNIFSLVLAKYFHKEEMAELMQNARSKKNKRADENVDEENGNDDLELEEPSTSINHQIPESNETETKSKEKAVLVYNSTAEEMQVNKPNKQILGSSSLVTSIQENEKPLELRRKGKSKEDFNVVQAQASVSTASASTDRNAMLIESTHNCCDKANRSQIQVPEKRTKEEFSQIDDNMEAFYASIEAESSALSLPQNSLNTRPSEETQIKLQYLQDLILKKFSLLLHPGRSGHLKNVLEFLLTLSPKDGIPLRMRSAMLQLSTSFSQWSLDYNDASLKLESATATVSNVGKLQEGLETNIKEFREAETFENMASSQLAILEARKRELEEQIKAIKAEIADFKSARDDAVQRKRKLYENGRIIQSEKDNLRNKVPRLRAEQEWARITKANIESEWSKLVQQFIESYTYGDLI
ncbi:hypothetical protein L6164_006267 [Bauhinia variegata]|uniref:Uncharacterized protein n=1 Tax=Bauhinia variegata TaxID=167791 RepID=A0ACB9PVC2_BAUVA|nr:hypothetical protein L6164_006267 [Bauhinia variegata]